MAIVIAHVRPEDVQNAYYWHRGFAAANDHLFPRTRAHYDLLTENYQLVGAQDENEYLGFCYYSDPDPESEEDVPEWEIGGLMVAKAARGKSLGSALMNVTLGNLLIDTDPLANGEWVISHVIKGNAAPRNLIASGLKFKHRRRVKIPGHVLPGLQTEADGHVHGDEFEMTVPETLTTLADWCAEWTGVLRDGTPAEIELRESLTLADWAEAFREMAKLYSP